MTGDIRAVGTNCPVAMQLTQFKTFNLPGTATAEPLSFHGDGGIFTVTELSHFDVFLDKLPLIIKPGRFTNVSFVY